MQRINHATATAAPSTLRLYLVGTETRKSNVKARTLESGAPSIEAYARVSGVFRFTDVFFRVFQSMMDGWEDEGILAVQLLRYAST